MNINAVGQLCNFVTVPYGRARRARRTTLTSEMSIEGFDNDLLDISRWNTRNGSNLGRSGFFHAGRVVTHSSDNGCRPWSHASAPWGGLRRQTAARRAGGRPRSAQWTCCAQQAQPLSKRRFYFAGRRFPTNLRNGAASACTVFWARFKKYLSLLAAVAIAPSLPTFRARRRR